jgi:two-component system chemotaxis sensor kinase CheA
MNDDLLEQFVAEARDLLAEAGADLLALERAPDDAARINRLFRSVHTLKGSSGLFDLPPLTRVLHAGEDLFQAVRERGVAISPEIVDVALRALDQTGKWLDELDRSETLPEDSALVATGLSAALRALFQAGPEKKPIGPALSVGGALPPAALAMFAPAALAEVARLPGTLHFISYRPPENCFFSGEDPLYLALQIPRLEAFALEARGPWETLASFDPFNCNLAFHAISSATEAELATRFRYVAADVTVAAFAAAALASPGAGLPGRGLPGGGLPETVRLLLGVQEEMLACPAVEAEAGGRFRAAARVAGHALRSCGRAAEAARVATAADGDALRAVIAELLGQVVATAPPADAPAGQGGEAAGAETPAAGDAPPAKRVLRVDQEKIDALMNLVGELVVAKNALPFLARRAEQHFGLRELSREIKDEYGVIDRIAQELQGAVMAVRMMPVGQVFQRFPRLIRDLARKLGKQVELEISGEDTEADKNVIESLYDPLLHMVRNSLDHGVETPEARRAAGKPETAILKLMARQEGDQAIIEIADDGAGIDPAHIRRVAYERGLMPEEKLAALDDEAAIMLIFAAGFSTAATISDVSGRGVGMDVVRAAVEKAGGRIALSSVKGKGTTVRLTLPLSMAVTRVMTVVQDDRLFGIPLDLVLETVKLPAAEVAHIKTAQAFVLRDRIVPLHHLTDLLELPPPAELPAEIAVLVVRIGGQMLGLGISAFGEVMEVILKPMEGMLSRITGYSGTCLLGDGRVLLVLDLKALFA